MPNTTRQITQISDDIFVYWNYATPVAVINNERWHVGRWSDSEQKCGGAGRFLDIAIEQNSPIIHAYLKITARRSDTSIYVRSKLYGQKIATPATFSDYADYAARAHTDEVVLWDEIPTWAQGVQYQSPDIKDVIQEIVNLGAWASGNPIVIFWEDHDARGTGGQVLRRGRSFEHASATPPVLYIEFEPPPAAVGRSFAYISA